MNRIVRLFWDICLLRAAPQDVPASPLLLMLAFAADAFFSIATQAEAGGLPRALATTAVGSGILLVMIYAALAARGHPARWMQTFTALFGSGAIIGLIAFPVTIWLGGTVEAGSGAAALPAMIWIGLLFWNLTVIGHVLRHALEIPFALGALFAAALLVLTMMAIGTLFPPPQG